MSSIPYDSSMCKRYSTKNGDVLIVTSKTVSNKYGGFESHSITWLNKYCFYAPTYHKGSLFVKNGSGIFEKNGSGQGWNWK